MIFGNINDLKDFDFLDSKIKACFDYMKRNELGAFEKGSYQINDDQSFVNIVDYITTSAENRFWEAHKKYLDIHVMLAGKEQIDLNFIQNMEQQEYVDKDDFLPLEGPKNSSLILNNGDFLICYPADGHRTAVAADEPEQIKKAIFKVSI